MSLSESIRDKTLEKVKPYLNPDNSETALLATIEKAADEAYGEVVDDILSTDKPLSQSQKVYLDTWDKKSFAEAVLKYARRNDLFTKKQEAEAPKETPKPRRIQRGRPDRHYRQVSQPFSSGEGTASSRRWAATPCRLFSEDNQHTPSPMK